MEGVAGGKETSLHPPSEEVKCPSGVMGQQILVKVVGMLLLSLVPKGWDKPEGTHLADRTFQGILGKQKALIKLGRSQAEIVRKTARTVILMWWLIFLFFFLSASKGMSRSYCTSYLRAFKQWDSFVLLNFTQQEEELLLYSATFVFVAVFFL